MFKPYKYIKEEPPSNCVEGCVENNSRGMVIRLPKPQLPTTNFRKWASVLLVTGGIFLLTNQILLPWLGTPPAQKPLLKPTSPSVAGATSGVKVEFEFTELAQPPEPRAVEPRTGDVPKVFYLTIPKLGIEKAEVETNSQSPSPDERLGHYPGSALPGEAGNAFIYGHSVLPMFYNPKNYRAIFSTLDELEKGDEVTVEFGDRIFAYKVESSVVLKPEDVRPLEPVSPLSLGDFHLTLMTCVPMGLGTDRLLVQARLIL